MIPGVVTPTSNANYPLNNVCSGAVTQVNLTSSVAPYNTYGSIYIFKDYQDYLYVTVAADGSDQGIDYPGAQPIITIPNIFTSNTATRMFAWPDLNLSAYSTYTNYNDQVTTQGR